MLELSGPSNDHKIRSSLETSPVQNRFLKKLDRQARRFNDTQFKKKTHKAVADMMISLKES